MYCDDCDEKTDTEIVRAVLVLFKGFHILFHFNSILSQQIITCLMIFAEYGFAPIAF